MLSLCRGHAKNLVCIILVLICVARASRGVTANGYCNMGSDITLDATGQSSCKVNSIINVIYT